MTQEADAPDPVAEPGKRLPLERLRAGIEQRDPATVHDATDTLRTQLEDAFQGRRLTPSSLLLERKRRAHQHLHAVDDDAAGARWADARERVGELADLVEVTIEGAAELPEAEAEEGGLELPAPFRNAWTVARKDAVLLAKGSRGLLLFGLLLLTFGIGLGSALDASTATGADPSVRLVWNYAHSLDFLAVPLAGILVGYGLINEEIASNTIHVLASQPVSRGGIVLGKFLGMALALAGGVLGSAALVGGVAYAATGTLGRPSAVFAYPIACYLLALAFGSLALLASALIDRTGPTLAAGFGAYILVGPVWQNLFLTGSLEAGGAVPSTGRLLTYLSTPFTAWWNWTSELLGPVDQATGLPTGEPWHAAIVQQVATGAREALPFYATQPFYVIVLVAWIAASAFGAALVLRRRDLG